MVDPVRFPVGVVSSTYMYCFKRDLRDHSVTPLDTVLYMVPTVRCDM